jgi:transaldolase
MSDALAALSEAGVSLWLDDLGRRRLTSGSLARLVRERHITGVTTNPSIIAAAVSSSDEYDDQLSELARCEVDPAEAVRLLTAYDVRRAADVLRGVHASTDGIDGRASIEVEPRHTDDAASIVAEARHLWWLVDRPNAFIKIPATDAGVPAITACLADGMSVNVTLIFSLDRYAQVTDAFLHGLEQALHNGRDLSEIASVASFFVSRVDTEVDRRLDEIGTAEAAALRGRAAIANARLAFAHHEDVLSSDRWARLQAAGARPQRPLWASTGVKDSSYDDTRYVTELITDGVVNTMPEPTLDAVADHGEVRGDTVRRRSAEAREVLAGLADVGVSFADVAASLEQDGAHKFGAAWNDLAGSLAERMRTMRRGTTAA